MFRPFAASSRYIAKYLGNLTSIHFWVLESDIFQREKNTLTFGFCLASVIKFFVFSPGSKFTLSCSWSNSNVSQWNPPADSNLIWLFLRMWSAIHRVLNVFPTFVAATSKDDDYDREGHRCRRCIFWLRGNFYDSFGSIGNGHHHLFCFFFVKRASELSTRHWAGSKLKCVELCNFYFCCALIFCQPMKKFEFLGVSRATRQRHFKTSSTGDENEWIHVTVCASWKV